MAPGDGARRDDARVGGARRDDARVGGARRDARDGSTRHGAPAAGPPEGDALAPLRRELTAARDWAADDPGPGAARTLAQVTGDLADSVAAATRAGRGPEARLLLAGAADGPVHPALRDAWSRALVTVTAVADAVTWPDGEPWGRLPASAAPVPAAPPGAADLPRPARRTPPDAQAPSGGPV